MTQAQLLVSSTDDGSTRPRYSLLVARDGEEVVAAQRLRYQVFAGELGARLRTEHPGLDIDAFDEHCDHLVVREDRTGEIVGCYRMLPPERVAAAGMLYSETEFDLRALAPLRGALVETGRSCVHPDHRTGAVVSLVWAGIARYLLLSGHRWLAGCASVSLSDGGSLAAGVWETVRHKHLAPARYQVRPLRPWDPAGVVPPARVVLPPLLKGYLRLGAWVCGPPAVDTDFGVADLFVLLGLDQVDQRYLSYLLGEQAP
ncbi:GNAT family N-acetyltransferase [Actinophytocola xinjiangensis]|uniref:GNAT family N-acetyltransferase n=1 Tax=Actinophytocola xinjiangensis TaxID=485602 RepID=A0A7Z1AW52_9PSEU|nr:GNAT family N-acyltransferase [Actinophytocola xinjiangensis]OLF08161.1 GNAT family N-acetyltransferase [Actinophytocola xinjiangensis]